MTTQFIAHARVLVQYSKHLRARSTSLTMNETGGYYGSLYPGYHAYSDPSTRAFLPVVPVLSGMQASGTASKLDEILSVLKSQQQEITSHFVSLISMAL